MFKFINILGYLPQDLDLSEDLLIADFLWQANKDLFMIRQKMETSDYSNNDAFSLFSNFEDINGYKFEARIEKLFADFGFLLTALICLYLF